LIWFKAPSSLLPHNGKVEIAFPEHQTDFETELAIVIGRRAKNVSAEQARDFIFGLHHRSRYQRPRLAEVGETIRALQIVRHLHADRTVLFMPISMLATCRSNCARTVKCGKKARTSQMIYSVSEIISFASQLLTFDAGDVILTGTPSGVGPIRAGDKLERES